MIKLMYLIYGRKTCPFTEGAHKLLMDLDFDVQFIKIQKLNDIPLKHRKKVRARNHNTVPAVFRPYGRGYKFLGGLKELQQYLIYEE